MATLLAGNVHSDSGNENAKWVFEKDRLVDIFDGETLLISIELTDLLALAMSFEYVDNRKKSDWNIV